MIKMIDRKQLERLFITHRFNDFKWLNPKNIVVSYWVRIKCMFGCNEYGKNACCPPNTPPVHECQSFFHEYTEGVVFHFKKKLKDPEQRHKWARGINKRLLKLEREVFLTGYQKAFMLFMDSCSICNTCTEDRINCKNKKSPRPAPEAMAIDVFSTVRSLNYPIEVLRDYSEPMNRYAFLLIR